jgi:hypothetical protein
LLWLAPFAQRVGPTEKACSLFRFVTAESVRRYTHKFNPIRRRFLSGSALGAKFEVVVRVVSAIEITFRHHRIAFQTKMFVSHRRAPSELIAVARPARARFDKLHAWGQYHTS